MIALLLQTCVAVPVLAQSSLQPILETLEFKQKQQQLLDAPYGNDLPLDEPQFPMQVQRIAQQIDTSSIETTMQEKQAPITLDEKIVEQIPVEPLKQFGYDLFNLAPLTFNQVRELPVPPDYLIGPGDSIIVQLYGARNVEYNLVVTRDGRLLLPELGPMEVSGLTFAEMKTKISTKYQSFSHRC